MEVSVQKLINSGNTVVPSEVMFDKELSPGSILFFGEILFSLNNHGYCSETNKYFSDVCNVDKRTIRNWLKELKDRNHIRVELDYFDGSKEIAERKIYLNHLPKGGMVHVR